MCCYADWYKLTEVFAEISVFFFTGNDINISDKPDVSFFFDYPKYENRILPRNVSTFILD